MLFHNLEFSFATIFMNGIAIYKISPGQTFPEMPDIRADEPILSFHGKVLFAALFLGAPVWRRYSFMMFCFSGRQGTISSGGRRLSLIFQMLGNLSAVIPCPLAVSRDIIDDERYNGHHE